ncbi:MAG: HNH endonuclease [Nanoarchaeota archaeon]
MKLIKLTQDKFAKVDDRDFGKVNQYKWYFSNKQGAATQIHISGSNWRERTQRKKTILMHRFILDAPKYVEVDHINGNRLDNRRKNIRLCAHADNMRNLKLRKDNTSGYKGVTKSYGKWTAHIQFNKKGINLGYFKDKKDAAKAYNEAAKKYFGEFARLNDI